MNLCLLVFDYVWLWEGKLSVFVRDKTPTHTNKYTNRGMHFSSHKYKQSEISRRYTSIIWSIHTYIHIYIGNYNSILESRLFIAIFLSTSGRLGCPRLFSDRPPASADSLTLPETHTHMWTCTYIPICLGLSSPLWLSGFCLWTSWWHFVCSRQTACVLLTIATMLIVVISVIIMLLIVNGKFSVNYDGNLSVMVKKLEW